VPQLWQGRREEACPCCESDRDGKVVSINPQDQPSVIRSLSARLTVALLTAFAAAPAPSLAQAAPAAPKAASSENLESMILAAAVTSCQLAISQKVPIEKASIASAEAVAFVVSRRNGSQIEGVGKLEMNQLVQGSFIQVIVGIKNGCYPKLEATDKQFVDNVYSQIEKSAKTQPKQQQPAKK
jgi:hypothetical protein